MDDRPGERFPDNCASVPFRSGYNGLSGIGKGMLKHPQSLKLGIMGCRSFEDSFMGMSNELTGDVDEVPP